MKPNTTIVEKVKELKEDKNVLSQGGLRTTYMAGFEDAIDKVLSLLREIKEDHDQG